MDYHEYEGHSVAAWVTVAIVTLAFALGSLAVGIANMPLLAGSVVLLVVGAAAGKVLARMGFGATGATEKSAS